MKNLINGINKDNLEREIMNLQYVNTCTFTISPSNDPYIVIVFTKVLDAASEYEICNKVKNIMNGYGFTDIVKETHSQVGMVINYLLPSATVDKVKTELRKKIEKYVSNLLFQHDMSTGRNNNNQERMNRIVAKCMEDLDSHKGLLQMLKSDLQLYYFVRQTILYMV